MTYLGEGRSIKMEKNAVFGELLYVGLVFEKEDIKVMEYGIFHIIKA